jgi:D-serine deaminase-like pyridoxal phosphate-dependent protein
LLVAANLPIDTWVKVDAGYGRTGVPWDDGQKLAELQDILGPSLMGLLVHSGHSYQARTGENLQAIWNTARDRLVFSRDLLGGQGLISVGDTPSCRAVTDLSGVDELRPGNFVFYDLMQLEIGACEERELAAAAVCPVVGVYPERGQVALHGGAVHLAKEYLDDGRDGKIFGKLGMLDFTGDGPALGPVLHEAPLVSLSQEHGIVAASPPVLDQLAVGDLVVVWPVHSCLTCDLHREYRTLQGETLSRR